MDTNLVYQIQPWILGAAIFLGFTSYVMFLVINRKKIQLVQGTVYIANQFGLKPNRYVQETIREFEKLAAKRKKTIWISGLISAVLMVVYVVIEFQVRPMQLAGGLFLGLAAALAFLCGERLSSRKYFLALLILGIAFALLVAGAFLISDVQVWYLITIPLKLPMLQA
jgi:hypothetical protein